MVRIMGELVSGGGDMLSNWLPFGEKEAKVSELGGGVTNEWRALYVLWLSAELAKVTLHVCYRYLYFSFCGDRPSCLLAWLQRFDQLTGWTVNVIALICIS